MPYSKTKQKKLTLITKSVKEILQTLNYDLKNEDLKETPKRVAKILIKELDKGKAEKNLFKVFPSNYTSMVTMLGHKSWTRCPHHLERVELTIDVAYIPNGLLVGLSKLARIADYFCRGLMLQEEVTDSIASGLWEALKPKGVAVHVVGEHLCLRARGVTSPATIVTTCLKGVFLEQGDARNEFMSLVHGKGGKT